MLEFWQPFWLSLRLAAATTVVLAALGLPLAYWLAFGRGRLRTLAHARVSLPLVLPPTVLGFYLLLLLSPAGTVGSFLDRALGLRLVFSFWGLVIGSVLFSLPFMVQPIESALLALPPSLAEAAYVLGKARWQTFWRVLLPNVRHAAFSGAVMTFAHTVGEFGVVLMLGGSIPGQTRTAAIAIYSEVEAMDYAGAHRHAFVLLFCALLLLAALEHWRRRERETA